MVQTTASGWSVVIDWPVGQSGTKPSPGMRKAIAEAEVGDDVFEDDPTVKELEQKVADLLGKEAGLFVPTGNLFFREIARKSAVFVFRRNNG